jgi:hypothetical protein
MSTSQGRDIAGPLSHHDDSLEEMANMLLEDTTIDQSKSDHGQPPSQIAAVRMLPSISSQNMRVLPQLPELHFNKDDAWAMNANTVVAAAGNFNEIQPFGGTNAPGNYPQKPFTHSRKGPPPIPRKSSKRKSARPMATDLRERAEPGNWQSDGPNSKKIAKGSISPPKYINVPQAKPSAFNDTNVNNKIEAMLEATKALKPGTGDHMLQGPYLYLPTKKCRLKDSNVLMKMKTAINDHIQARVSKKSYDPARDDYLLDDALNETQTDDKGMPGTNYALRTMEIRMNEGR